MEYFAFLLSGYIWRVLSNRISNIDTAPTFSITKAGAVFFSVSGNDKSRQIGLAKSKIQIKPCGGEEGDNDGRREDTVRKSEHETRPQGRKGVEMTNQSYASEATRRNIPWAEVAKIFHL